MGNRIAKVISDKDTPLVGNSYDRTFSHVNQDALTNVIISIFESAYQAEYDFVGEQREFHLPRLRVAKIELMKLFPLQAINAMEQAKDPYGNHIV